jgi:hypothetical protein
MTFCKHFKVLADWQSTLGEYDVALNPVMRSQQITAAFVFPAGNACRDGLKWQQSFRT